MEHSGRGSNASPAHYSGMQFGERTPAQGSPNPATPNAVRPTKGNPKKSSRGFGDQKWTRIGAGIFGLLILAVAVWAIIGLAFSDDTSEADYVDSSRLQAVFLQTGQVYFGNVKALSNDYIDLTNIYYLQTSDANANTNQSANSTNNVSLVKLGCELHAPQDRMLINREQVTFWENLNTDGQVAKAVASFQKSNPNGQKCSDTPASDSTNVQGTTPTTNNSNTSTNNEQQ